MLTIRQILYKCEKTTFNSAMIACVWVFSITNFLSTFLTIFFHFPSVDLLPESVNCINQEKEEGYNNPKSSIKNKNISNVSSILKGNRITVR